MINSTNEQQAAAKCFQNQEKLFLNDVKVSGRLMEFEMQRRARRREGGRFVWCISF